MATLTVLVPAYNEEEGLPDTLDSLLLQEELPDAVIVVDDFSSDRTREVAERYIELFDGALSVVTPESNLGSKAAAQNFGLRQVVTDLVLPVDADTTLDANYIRLVKKAFDDPEVAVAAGCVLTKRQETVYERGRQMEYLHSFHYYRPIQQLADSVTVCSGCCTIFRVSFLREFGGFPSRTIVEDIDYTWSQQIMGRRAVYVADAVARAAEPVSAKYLGKQLKRWKSGYFQNVRRHFPDLLRKKPMLALWVTLQMFEMFMAPVVIALTVATFIHGASVGKFLALAVLGELLFFWPVVLIGARRRSVPFWSVVRCYPSWYALKAFNFYYDMTRAFVELVLVPLRLHEGLHTYEKGRADAAGEASVDLRMRNPNPVTSVEQRACDDTPIWDSMVAEFGDPLARADYTIPERKGAARC